MTDQSRLLYVLWAASSLLVALSAWHATPMRPWSSLVLLVLAGQAVFVFSWTLWEGR